MVFTIIGLLGIILAYFFVKQYSDENGKILPFSTPEGKIARIFGGLILLGLITISIFDTDPNLSSEQNVVLSIEAIIVAVFVTWLSIQRRK